MKFRSVPMLEEIRGREGVQSNIDDVILRRGDEARSDLVALCRVILKTGAGVSVNDLRDAAHKGLAKWA